MQVCRFYEQKIFNTDFEDEVDRDQFSLMYW